MHSFSRVLRAFLLFAAFLAGCATSPPGTGFLTMQNSLREGEHFKKEFVFRDRDLGRFLRIKVEPVEIIPPEAAEGRRGGLLAARFRDAIEERLARSFNVAGRESAADAETLVVRPVLSQAGAAGMPADYAHDEITLFSPETRGTAFEAKLVDGGTGHLIAEVGEKRAEGFRLDFGGPDAVHEKAFEKWAARLSEMIFLMGMPEGVPEPPVPPAAESLKAEDIEEIEKLHMLWWREILNHNPRGAADYFMEQTVMVPPGGEEIKGSGAAAAWLESNFGTVSSVMVNDHKLHGGGGMAYMLNRYSLVRLPGEDEILARTDRGTQVWIYRKDPGGKWEIAFLMWSLAAGDQEPLPALPSLPSSP